MHKCFTIIITCLITLAGAGKAFSDNVIEEVTVTAQKREQSINEVPISISVLDEKLLKDAGLNDVTTLIAYVPGLNGSSAGVITNSWNIRGIGTNDWSTGSEPAVAVYMDEAYIGRNVLATTGFFDVERIEVLKGPQGTLLGRNASAGAINIITNKPTDSNSLYLAYGAGSVGTQRIEAIGNWSASNSFGLRLAFLDKKIEGIATTVNNGKELFQDETMARLTARWDVADNVEVLLSGSYNDTESNRTRPHHPTLAAIFDLPGANDDFAKETTADSPSLEDIEAKGIDLRVNWDINGSLSFTSITDWRTSDLLYEQDVDGVGAPLFFDLIPDLPLALFFDGPTFFLQPSVADDTFSQEIRFNGSTDTLDWFLGASFFTEDIHEESRFSWPLTIDLDTLIGGGGVITVLTDDQPSRTVVNGDNTSWGVYTDVSWRLSNRVTLTGGLRWTGDKKDFCSTNYDPTFGIVPILGPDTGGEAICDSETWSKFTPRVVASFYASDDVMLYASFSQGYKGGGYNTTVVGAGDLTSPFSLKLFDQETSDAYEVGMKGTFLDGGMQFNVAAYYTDYKDFQLLDTDLSFTIDNIGDVESKGVEAEIGWVPSGLDGLTLKGYGAYNKSTIKAPGFSIDGSVLPLAPKWTAGVTARYEWRLSDTGTLATFVGYNWLDDMIFDVNGARFHQDSYGVLDASLQYIHNGGRWNLTLSGYNLTDKGYLMAAADPLGLGAPSSIRANPRTVMLLLGVTVGSL